MDTAEQIAEQHLLHRQLGAVVHEPDGNVTPDFLVDGRIAVEVRRLIQHEDREDRPRGLDEVAIPLLQAVRAQLRGHGPPQDQHSWFFYYRFKRPVPPWKELRTRLAAHLREFQARPIREPEEFELADRFSFKLFRASRTHEHMFVLGGYNDEDSGGWLLHEVRRNAEICIDEKLRKIAPRRHLYPEWWLLLVDHVGLGLDPLERELLREGPKLAHAWDKVVVVDPRDPTRYYEI